MSGSDLCIPRNKTALPCYFQTELKCYVSQFPHLCICERFIYSQDQSVYFAATKQVDWSWEYINCSQIHECRNWERGHAVSFLEKHKSDFRYMQFGLDRMKRNFMKLVYEQKRGKGTFIEGLCHETNNFERHLS